LKWLIGVLCLANDPSELADLEIFMGISWGCDMHVRRVGRLR
jgi:hypothetical protein